MQTNINSDHRGSTIGALVGVLVIGWLAGILAPAAQAAESAPAVTWAVSPADASGPDGRSWVELELAPGGTTVDHLALRNLGAESTTFSLTAADGYFTSTGRFNMMTSDAESVDAGTWILVEPSVTVGAGETVVVPFTVVVPQDAEPGDHAAGIAASVLSEQAGADGTRVGVESRVGFRVMTRVTGDLRPLARIERLTAEYNISWNPFAPGSVGVSFDVVNAGNARFTVGGTVDAGGATVTYPGAEEGAQEFLPGERRRLTRTVTDVWPVVLLPVDVIANPTVVTPGGPAATADSVRSEVSVWAIPWPQLVALLGIALILFGIFGSRRRSRRRMAQMLAQARAEGARTAAQAPREQP